MLDIVENAAGKVYPSFEEEGVYCVSSVCPSVLPSVTNIFRCTFLSKHASQPLQPWLGVLSYRSLTKFRFASYLLPVLRLGLFSDIPSVTNIFQHTLLSYHASQPLQTWYGISARGRTCCLQNSGPPFVYFLFYDLVYFPTEHGNMANFCHTLRGSTMWLVKICCHLFLHFSLRSKTIFIF